MSAQVNTEFRLTKSTVEDLTPELAAKFQSLEPSPTERELNPSRVKHLAEKAENGQLVTFHWSTAKFSGKTLRMNGQHSSNMLVGLNGSFPKGLKAHIDEYEVHSPEGLAILFRQFDDRKSGRTSSDVAGAYQGLYEPLRDVPKASAKLGADGIAWFRRHVEGTPVPSGDEAYTLFAETGIHSFIRWTGEVFSIKTPELKRTQIVSAMYATFIRSETAARTFWEQVARGGLDFEDNAPSTVLDVWLKSIKEDRDNSRDLKPGNYYQGCIFAWNAFREEKTIKDIKCDVKKGFHKIIE